MSSSGRSTAAGGATADPTAQRGKIMEAQLVTMGFSPDIAAALAAVPEVDAPPASDTDAKRAKVVEAQIVSKGFNKEQARLAVNLGPDAIAVLMQAGGASRA